METSALALVCENCSITTVQPEYSRSQRFGPVTRPTLAQRFVKMQGPIKSYNTTETLVVATNVRGITQSTVTRSTVPWGHYMRGHGGSAR